MKEFKLFLTSMGRIPFILILSIILGCSFLSAAFFVSDVFGFDLSMEYVFVIALLLYLILEIYDSRKIKNEMDVFEEERGNV